MKITNIDTPLCDGGWWPWIFVKVQTSDVAGDIYLRPLFTVSGALVH